MTAPSTTLPTVKAWLFNRLSTVLTADTAAGKTLSVNYSAVSQDEDDDEITVGTGERRIEPLALVGGMQTGGAWQESYDIPVTVSVWRPEGFQAAEERMWALVAAIENVVRVDMWAVIAGGTAAATFGGAVWSVMPQPHNATPEWADEQRGPLVQLTYPITVRAEL